MFYRRKANNSLCFVKNKAQEFKGFQQKSLEVYEQKSDYKNNLCGWMRSAFGFSSSRKRARADGRSDDRQAKSEGDDQTESQTRAAQY